jgi:hypothetical protein
MSDCIGCRVRLLSRVRAAVEAVDADVALAVLSACDALFLVGSDVPEVTGLRWQSAGGVALSVRREFRGGRQYWYAYKWDGCRVAKHYVGRDLDTVKLARIAERYQ